MLDGSVRSSGNKLRIAVQLNNVSDGFQRWSESYDRSIEDVFAVQDEIAASIVEALQVELGGEAAPEFNRSTENLAAYKEYLQGRYLWLQRRPEDIARSKAHFERALESDPNYALAYAGLADLYAVQVLYGLVSSPELTPLALEALEKAIELDPDLSEAHSSMVFVRGFLEWDWIGGVAAADRSIELNPSNVMAWSWGACAAEAAGQPERANEMLQRARELDPLSPYVSSVSALVSVMLFDNEKAAGFSRDTLQLQPDYLLSLYALGLGVRSSGAQR